MLPNYFLLALPVIYYYLNWIRGQGYGFGGHGMGLVTGALAFVFTQDYLIAAAMAITMFLGELPGWGRWLANIPHLDQRDPRHPMADQPSRGKIIHKLAEFVAEEKDDLSRYTKVCLGIRGLVWTVPVAVASQSPWMAVGLLGVLFPYAYIVAYRKDPLNYWPLGEKYFGVIWGVILAFLLWR